MPLKLKAFQLIATDGMIGQRVAVKLHNRLYCSPAMKHLIEEADSRELSLLEQYLPVMDMAESPVFQYSLQHKEIATLAKEGEDVK